MSERPPGSEAVADSTVADACYAPAEFATPKDLELKTRVFQERKVTVRLSARPTGRSD